MSAEFGLLPDATAVIEMAAASGLTLLPPSERNPLHTTSYGTGQLVLAALDQGAGTIIIGIGGSATNDCGAGMAQALGVRFYAGNVEISEYMTGGLLGQITDIDLSHLDARCAIAIRVACDVDNPLLGERGATRLYGPQKGATPSMVEQLEENMRRFTALVEEKTRPVRNVPGAGAAGGLGAGLLAFLNAELSSGIDIVLDACGFDEHIRDAALILTGEGRIDAQSAMGKTISGVLKRARAHGVPVIAIGGTISDDADVLFEHGLLSMFSICDRPMTLEYAIINAETLIEKAAERIARLFFQVDDGPPA